MNGLKNKKLIIKTRAVIRNSQLVLLCYYKKGGFYFLPGGTLENGENALACLERELHEELYLSIKVNKFLGMIECHYNTSKPSENKQIDYQEFSFIFDVEQPTSILNKKLKSNEAHISFHAIPLEQIPSLKILPNSVKKILIEPNQSCCYFIDYE